MCRDRTDDFTVITVRPLEQGHAVFLPFQNESAELVL